MTDRAPERKSLISGDPRISARTVLPSLGTIFSALAIVFLVYAFFKGLTFQFYASFVFLFYGVTKSMWISVIMLGVFQTLLMIPFRIIRMILSNNIKEFQRTVEHIENQNEQGFTLKKGFQQGNSTFLFYSVDFVMQLVSYISIGRLFLTDFYTHKLNPAMLYNWVTYPQYPIRDTFFKIPYPVITHTIDFGWKVLLPVWIVLVIVQLGILVARRTIRQQHGQATAKQMFSGGWTRYTTGYLLLFLAIAYLVVHHFPTGWAIRIFSGDVAFQNTRFNTITAIVTFFTLLWHGVPRIARKGRLAEALGVPTRIIEATQMEMLRDTFFNAAVVGLGAFYITNHIPSAFELSIFTLEIISLAAPFTLDKLVLKGLPTEANDDDTEEDVLHEFGHEGVAKPAEVKAEEKVEEKPTESKHES